jgi:hypothetical protein
VASASQETSVFLWVGRNACSNGPESSSASDWNQYVTRTGNGLDQLTFPDGLAVPTGDYLCAYTGEPASGQGNEISSSGYYLPSGSVTIP